MEASRRVSVSRSSRVSAVPATMARAGDLPIEGGIVARPATIWRPEVEIGFQAAGVGGLRGYRPWLRLGRNGSRPVHPSWAQGPEKWRRRDNGSLYRALGPTPDLNDHTTGMSPSITCGASGYSALIGHPRHLPDSQFIASIEFTASMRSFPEWIRGTPVEDIPQAVAIGKHIFPLRVGLLWKILTMLGLSNPA